MAERRELLRAMFDAAVASAQPEICLPRHLPVPPPGRTVVVGAGKASAEMARVLEHHWRGPLSGVVVTRRGHGVPCRNITIVEAGHPVPDEAGVGAARDILAAVSGLGADDLVIVLISGGGSALLTLPGGALTLADKQAATRAALASGAPIGDINTLRKHLSAIKGGRLAVAAYPAPVLTLAISDVPGDDPGLIASGPTVPDTTTAADARAALTRRNLVVSDAVRRHLESAAAESPDPADPRFANATARLIATPRGALEAAAELARDAGYRVELLGDAVEGEASDVGAAHGRLARAAFSGTVILSGGELTVTLSGNVGQGGPSGEYALGLARAVDGRDGVTALACDTDGIDGTGPAAGAFADGATVARARARGLDAGAFAAAHDSHTFFAALNDLVVTGPTRTNVNDFRAIVVD